MNDEHPDDLLDWEERVRDTARNFSYPPTPDIASQVSRTMRPRRSPALRRVAQAAALILLALAALMAVPEIRAAVMQALRIGSVTIFTFTTPTPTPTAFPTNPATAFPTMMATRPLPERPTIAVPTAAEPAFVTSVLDLPGETTLAEAQAASQMSIQLPTYPPDLGPPDRVFLQRIGGAIVTLVWTQPDAPTQVRLAIQVLDDDTVANKYDSYEGQTVAVNGSVAYWLSDTHQITYWDSSGVHFTRRVNANVLIWTVGRLTYRLESQLSLEEALQVAESVQ